MPVVMQRPSDGDAILCEEAQVAVFAGLGYQRTNHVELSSQNQPVSVAKPVPSGLIRMVKDSLEVTVEASQLSVFESQGWTPFGGSVTASEPPQQPSSNTGGGRGTDLKAVLQGLDAADSDLWTVDGLIKLAALKEFTGHEVTRADVEAAWPGFKREVLKSMQNT